MRKAADHSPIWRWLSLTEISRNQFQKKNSPHSAQPSDSRRAAPAAPQEPIGLHRQVRSTDRNADGLWSSSTFNIIQQCVAAQIRRRLPATHMMSPAPCYDPTSRTYTVRHVGDRAVWQRFLLCRLLSAHAAGIVHDEREDTAWTRRLHLDGTVCYINGFSRITVREPLGSTPLWPSTAPADWLSQFYSALCVESFAPALAALGVSNMEDLSQVTMQTLVVAGMSSIQCTRCMRALREMGTRGWAQLVVISDSEADGADVALESTKMEEAVPRIHRPASRLRGRLYAPSSAAEGATKEAEVATARREEKAARVATVEVPEAARAGAEEQEAARVAAEKHREQEVARVAAEEHREQEATRVAAEEQEAARVAAEKHREQEVARVAAEEQQAARVAAHVAAEEQEAARVAAEEEEAARVVAEKHREQEAARVAARVAAEEQEAARVAAEEQEAARVVAEMQAQQWSPEDANMRVWFESFDANADGYLDMEEVHALIQSLGVGAQEDAYVQAMFEKLSPQVPGKVDPVEFRRIWHFLGAPTELPQRASLR